MVFVLPRWLMARSRVKSPQPSLCESPLTNLANAHMHYIYITLHYITLHYITSFHTPITPTVTNGASTKSFKFSECELKKVSFQKFFEGISVCEFLKIGRKRIPCLMPYTV